ncbi:phage/plasmid primase, P4 family [Streptosporangium sp. NPDC006930]|uniref:phage/plasmid primase, P4 family n=1 Tax=Streptosporangium sp. NPDC006930 TaxID=3154783 RepID=UPI0034298184
MNDSGIRQAARDLYEAGLCVLPAAADGTKRPAGNWKQYQHARPDPVLIEAWFAEDAHGVGVVTGAVSDNLEMLELEGRAVREGLPAELTALADASGLGDLWRKVTSGYLEMTPSGGIHILYKVDGPVAGNTKLARRPSTAEELAAWKADQQASIDTEDDPAIRAKRQETLDRVTRGEQVPQVLAETRGEGGWVVLAPSAGPVHPTGGAWFLAAGGPATIATVTPEERDALHHLAGAFDQMPTGTTQPPTAPAAPAPAGTLLFTQPTPFDDGSISPGDDYNAKTTWDEILTVRGWTKLYTDSAGVTYWRRPGKKLGLSATTGKNDADNLYVWTTSTEFEAERPYDKFGAYAHLEHGGDHSAAARALQAAGYGHRVEPTRAAPALVPPPLVDGTLATVHQLPAAAPHLTVVEQRTYAQSDDGLALDLADHFGNVVRYCPDRGRWLAWDGHRWEWQPQGGGLVREYGKQIARGLPEDDKPSVNHKKRALSALGTTAMLTQAQTDVRLVVAFDELDAQPWELNTPAGIVDLRTGTLGPSDASRLHTKVTAVSPDTGADVSRWQEFLADTFGGHEELIGYLQRLVGYSATGSVARHVLPFAVGSGGNGKGVFLESLVAVLGDYATTAPSGFLMAKSHAGHETEIARLAGMRMVVCSEVADDDRFDEVKVKQLTGGDSLTARFMRQDHFTFTPTHHLWLMGNHQPSVRAGGRSFWRRLRLIPFEHEVPEEKMVDDLQGILARDHGPALLAWIVAGAAEYAAHGLMEPEEVKAATAGYAADQDTVSRFVADACHLGGGVHVQIKKTALREAYERWCFSEGETPVSAKKLTMELVRKHGVGEDRTGASRFYTGITLLQIEDEDPSSGAADPSQGFTQPSHPTTTPESDSSDKPEWESDKIGGPGW